MLCFRARCPHHTAFDGQALIEHTASVSEPNALKQTGQGTPMGIELRRSWHAIAVAGEITADHPIKPVRLLSEGLVLFRTSSGRLGLIQERCTHHGVLLAYGHVEEDRLVCPLHGWCFEVDGSCSVVAYQGKVYPMSWATAKSYTVAEYAGLVWAYLGTAPAPALPTHDALGRHDGRRRISVYPKLNRNWMDLSEDDPLPRSPVSPLGPVGTEALLGDNGRRNSVWLRTPVDDTHTWQVLVEMIPLDARSRGQTRGTGGRLPHSRERSVSGHAATLL